MLNVTMAHTEKTVTSHVRQIVRIVTELLGDVCGAKLGSGLIPVNLHAHQTAMNTGVTCSTGHVTAVSTLGDQSAKPLVVRIVYRVTEPLGTVTHVNHFSGENTVI